jgi:hypothetical protein
MMRNRTSSKQVTRFLWAFSAFLGIIIALAINNQDLLADSGAIRQLGGGLLPPQINLSEDISVVSVNELVEWGQSNPGRGVVSARETPLHRLPAFWYIVKNFDEVMADDRAHEFAILRLMIWRAAFLFGNDAQALAAFNMLTDHMLPPSVYQPAIERVLDDVDSAWSHRAQPFNQSEITAFVRVCEYIAWGGWHVNHREDSIWEIVATVAAQGPKVKVRAPALCALASRLEPDEKIAIDADQSISGQQARETLQSLAREDETAKRYVELLEEIERIGPVGPFGPLNADGPGRGWYR